MPGIKGMKRPSFSHVVRRQIWRSMRIMRRFSQPDLMRTAPAATPANVKKYIGHLVRHGYVVKDGNFKGGRTGEFQTYRLIHDTGPAHPTRCEFCGGAMSDAVCNREKKKETNKERETNKESPEVIHDAA